MKMKDPSNMRKNNVCVVKTVVHTQRKIVNSSCLLFFLEHVTILFSQLHIGTLIMLLNFQV